MSNITSSGTLHGVIYRGAGGGTTDYNALSNKPKINNVTVSGDKTGHDYNLANLSDVPVIPTPPPSYAMNSHDDDYTTADLEWIKSNDEEKQWKVYSNAFTPPTALTDGQKGLVPKAEAGEQDKILSASGWITNKMMKDFSTSVINTGLKWIDGKDVYQITYKGTMTTNAVHNIALAGLTDVDEIIALFGGYTRSNNNLYIPFNFYSSNSFRSLIGFSKTNNGFRVEIRDDAVNSCTVKLTMLFTKTS